MCTYDTSVLVALQQLTIDRLALDLRLQPPQAVLRERLHGLAEVA